MVSKKGITLVTYKHGSEENLEGVSEDLLDPSETSSFSSSDQCLNTFLVLLYIGDEYGEE